MPLVLIVERDPLVAPLIAEQDHAWHGTIEQSHGGRVSLNGSKGAEAIAEHPWTEQVARS